MGMACVSLFICSLVGRDRDFDGTEIKIKQDFFCYELLSFEDANVFLLPR